MNHKHRSEAYDSDAHETRKVSGPLPLIMLEQGSDKYDATDDAGVGMIGWIFAGIVATLIGAIVWAVMR